MRLHLVAMLVILTGVAAPVQAAPEGQKDPSSRIRCKSIGDTGSRVRSTRVCKTQAEWELEEQAAQEGLADLQRRDGGYGQTRDGATLPGMGNDTDRGTSPR